MATLSKEKYISERAAGKTRSQIARDFGITRSQLMYQVSKWELDDASKETGFMDNRTLTGNFEDLTFDWLLPDTATPTIRINRGGIRITGDVISKLADFKHAEIGFNGRYIAIRGAHAGWPISRKKASQPSCIISSKRILPAALARGFQSGDSGTAYWDEKRKIIVARIGGPGEKGE